jgi:3',5'-cyclic AMP phosphodiesterase CpdA
MPGPPRPERRKDDVTKLGKHLFTFAVVADSHMTEADAAAKAEVDISFETARQELGNARSRHVVHEINRFGPDFLVHLGDITHPVPRSAEYDDSARQFHEVYAELTCPLHLVPGNHDVGEKLFPAVPAGQSIYTISDETIAAYERAFQPQFFSFEHEDCLFVVINAMIVNSGLDCEAAQRDWLERLLADNDGRRVFVFSHYPPYLADPGETQHYDAIDEPGRGWLLGLLRRHRVEAFFAGHVHNYFVNLYADTRYYVLPSICFLRHDYHVLFPVGPGRGQGVNDVAKLGYAVVDVYQRGHVNRILRSYGATLWPGETLPVAPRHLPPVDAANRPAGSLGIDLSEAWCATADVRTPWGLDAFRRKVLRNDYPLLALDEMGVRKLRVPLDDLQDDRTRARIADLIALGYGFTVFSFGVPCAAVVTAMSDHAALVEHWEVIAPLTEARAVIRAIVQADGATPPPVRINAYRPDVEAFSTSHGLRADERGAVQALLALDDAPTVVDGVVFGVARDEPAVSAIRSARASVDGTGVTASVHLSFARDTPVADGAADDLNRLAEAATAAVALPEVDVFVDNFTPIDRGYFYRSGLVDRLYNPGKGSHVVRHLHAALAPRCALGAPHAVAGGRAIVLDLSGTLAVLVLPDGETSIDRLPAGAHASERGGDGRWIDLVSGDIGNVSWTPDAGAAGPAIVLNEPMTCRGPALVIL